MKRKKAALYNPYLDTMGGGERHILSILKALEDSGYEVTLFWDTDLSSEIKSKLGVKFIDLQLLPNITHKTRTQRADLLSKFDLFLYVTDGSYFFSSAKKNYVFAMVPQKDLYHMNWINRLKTKNYTFVTNSFYTQKWLSKWNIRAEVIYPYINSTLLSMNVDVIKKEPFILSVGRFFSHLHSKKQEILIKFFLKAQEQHPEFASFKLILAGGLMPADEKYFRSLQALTEGSKSITFYPNIDGEKLTTLYKKAQYYWHAAGYGVDQNMHPEAVEHLGISPLEAMSTGCITFCYKVGGPEELIKDDVNGFLYKDYEDLCSKMLRTMKDRKLQTLIIKNAKEFVRQYFSYDVFKKRVKEILLPA